MNGFFYHFAVNLYFQSVETQQNATGSIKAWAEDDRPREKLLTKGRSALSHAELLAILIGSGTQDISAVQLSQQILSSADNSLRYLGKCTVEEFCKFKGIGKAKAVTIVAAMELARRGWREEHHQPAAIKSSQEAFAQLSDVLRDLPHEEFWILQLNRANHVIGRSQISRGGITGTVADVRIIFRNALEKGACSIILAHNHPSGNLRPSRADEDLTRKMSEAGKLIDIPVLDHLILTDHGYFSFADEGLL